MAKQIEFAEYITADGKTYNFDNRFDRFLLTSVGEGMPPIEFITQRGPFQQSETVLDYRLQPRIIQYLHRRKYCNRYDYYDTRADMLNYLRPNRHNFGEIVGGTLRRRLPNGSIRDIKVFLSEGLQFNDDPEAITDNITEVLRFIAHDPIFYDPTLKTVTGTADLTNTELVFDADFPIQFGETLYTGTIDVPYAGTWYAYPIITITGPCRGFYIKNTDTNQTIMLNKQIRVGETVTITLDEGNKTVISSVDGNVIGAIDLTTDLTTFYLGCDPEVANGLNHLQVAAAGSIDAITSISIQYYERYIGF